MTDLESLLREEFRQPTGYVRESVDDLIASTRRTRRRRDIGAASGAAAAVVAVVALVVALGHVGTHRPQPAQPQKIDRSTAEAILGVLTKSGTPVSGRFDGHGQGVIDTLACPEKSPSHCVTWLARTNDGGAAFTPVQTGDALISESQVYYFDTTHIVIDDQRGTATGDEPLRLVSADGGASWTSVQVDAGAPLGVIPKGDRLLDISDALIPGTSDALGVIGPDGVIHPLSTSPAAGATPVDPSGEAFAGADFVTNDQGLWVSTDSGATWHTVSIESGAAPGDTFFDPVGADGDRIFATVGDGTDLTLERSDDHGLTWKALDWPAPGVFPFASLRPDDAILRDWDGRGVAVLDGVGAFVTNGAQMWVMRSGSDVFVPDDVFQPVFLSSFSGVLIGVGPDSAHPALFVSTDGEHWIRSTMGK